MSKINPNQGPAATDAVRGGVSGTQIAQSEQAAQENLSVSDVVGQGFEAGHGGGAVAKEAVPTGGISRELVQSMAALVDSAGVIAGDQAELGDVDIDVSEEAILSIPSGERALRLHGEIRRVFAGENLADQTGVTRALTSIRDSLRWHQGALVDGVDPGIVSSASAPLVTDILQNASQDTILSTAQTQFSEYLDQLPVDVNALVQWVLRQSYLEATQDLAFFADKVRFYNGVKKEIRKELERARNALSDVAGGGDDATISPAWVPAEISDEYYGPEGGEEDMSVEGTGETEAPEETVDPRWAEYDGLLAQWQAAPDVATTHAGSNISEEGNNHSNKIDDSDAQGIMWDKAGSGWSDDVVRWFQNLEPDVQAAYVEKWQTDGLKFVGWAHETHWKDESYTSSETRTLGVGEDPVAWLREETQRTVENTASGITHKDGGNSLKLQKFNFRIEPGDISVSTRPPKPEELVALERELGTETQAPTDVASYSPGDPISNKAHLETYIENMEQKLSSVGDDAQLANVDLQNMLQKQQQTLQLMSNISKMLHDTALAIIRKMG